MTVKSHLEEKTKSRVLHVHNNNGKRRNVIIIRPSRIIISYLIKDRPSSRSDGDIYLTAFVEWYWCGR